MCKGTNYMLKKVHAIQGCIGIDDFVAKHKVDILMLQEVKVGKPHKLHVQIS